MIFFKKIRYNKLTDSELLILYKNGKNTEVVGELFSRYSHLVYGVCLNYLKNQQNAKDAVLSIFENIINDLMSVDIENFKAWLYIVTRNYCLMQIRTKQRQMLREKIFSDEFESEILPNEFDFIKNSNEYNEVYMAINKLNNEQRICIELFYLQNKSYSQIIEITNFSNNQVKSFIQNGKRNLRNILTLK